MKSKRDAAVAKMLEGYECAQSVFYAYCDDLAFEKDTALRIASGFGGGMAGKGEVCGAVTGGIIVIGAKYGRGEKDDRAATNLAFTKTRQLMDEFAGKHGTFICRKLLNGCELTSKEGRKAFRENDLLNKICVPCVESAVEILENLI